MAMLNHEALLTLYHGIFFLNIIVIFMRIIPILINLKGVRRNVEIFEEIRAKIVSISAQSNKK